MNNTINYTGISHYKFTTRLIQYIINIWTMNSVRLSAFIIHTPLVLLFVHCKYQPGNKYTMNTLKYFLIWLRNTELSTCALWITMLCCVCINESHEYFNWFVWLTFVLEGVNKKKCKESRVSLQKSLVLPPTETEFSSPLAYGFYFL